MIGDPRDENVYFSTQQLYFDGLKKRNLPAWLLPLEKAPEGYAHFDARDEGWTKVVLKTAA